MSRPKRLFTYAKDNGSERKRPLVSVDQRPQEITFDGSIDDDDDMDKTICIKEVHPPETKVHTVSTFLLLLLYYLYYIHLIIHLILIFGFSLEDI